MTGQVLSLYLGERLHMQRHIHNNSYNIIIFFCTFYYFRFSKINSVLFDLLRSACLVFVWDCEPKYSFQF